MKLVLAGDHAGFAYKKEVFDYLSKKGFEVLDEGAFSDASVDYPDFVHPAATKVERGDADFGFLFCGSANGVAITANKHQGVRAAIAWKKELAALARQHNNANMLAIPCRFIDLETALAIIDAFLTTAFEGGRHENRVNKIAC